MTYLYLIRHGETMLNKKGVYYGLTDCELNSKGINQCLELKNLQKEFDVVISSPLKRAVKTAEIISGLDKKDIVIDKELREINFGKWEGLDYKEISNLYKKEWTEWINKWKTKAPPEGESFINHFNRVNNAISNILNVYKGKKIMIVSHQGCLRIITSILINMNDKVYWNFNFEHGRYSLFEIQDGHLTIRRINAKD